MRVRFIADFDWSPAERQGRVTVAYKAGMELRVTRVCAAAAIEAGKAEAIVRKKPDERG
ncbi:hypothetical protein [Kaistia defluvii]|uniref:Uncharacterized protein n=1 Tax=Kaistia defluvii TaxID=410841 RepID=A0ABV2R573_9HYPH